MNQDIVPVSKFFGRSNTFAQHCIYIYSAEIEMDDDETSLCLTSESNKNLLQSLNRFTEVASNTDAVAGQLLQDAIGSMMTNSVTLLRFQTCVNRFVYLQCWTSCSSGWRALTSKCQSMSYSCWECCQWNPIWQATYI